VLDYFDSFLIGLTATPTAQTIGFFNNNLVMEYGHEQAVADGVNVGFDVYRIRTHITEQGATLEGEPGRFIPRRDRRTRSKRYAELDDDLRINNKLRTLFQSGTPQLESITSCVPFSSQAVRYGVLASGKLWEGGRDLNSETFR